MKEKVTQLTEYRIFKVGKYGDLLDMATADTIRDARAYAELISGFWIIEKVTDYFNKPDGLFDSEYKGYESGKNKGD